MGDSIANIRFGPGPKGIPARGPVRSLAEVVQEQLEKEENMKVRAKFTVDSIERRKRWDGEEQQTVKMSPVSGNESEENRKFWEATPTGKLEIGCAKAETAGLFELGREYYVDFTPAN